jgi:hypothetical protein
MDAFLIIGSHIATVAFLPANHLLMLERKPQLSEKTSSAACWFNPSSHPAVP